MSTSNLTILLRSYTPFAFRAETERRIVAGLCLLSGVVWLLVIPLEFALYT